MEKDENKKEVKRCPFCNSTLFYYVRSEEVFKCRHCGEDFKKEDVE